MISRYPGSESPLNTIVSVDAMSTLTRQRTEESLTAEGVFDGRFIANSYGRNADVDTGSIPEDIWALGGVYTGFPTGSAETLDILSSSANDAAAGTGMRTLRIIGLDANYDLQTEDVTLNGATGVTTAGTWRRVFMAYGLTAGSTGTNEGNITIQHTTTTANVFAYMLIGYGQTENSNYTIPAGYTGYLRSYSASVLNETANGTTIAIWCREFGGAVRLLRSFAVDNTFEYRSAPYGGIKLQEKTDFIFRALDVVADNANVSVSYDLVLVRN